MSISRRTHRLPRVNLGKQHVDFMISNDDKVKAEAEAYLCALERTEVEQLRDHLTRWLDTHPVSSP